jgi:ectoine hydroxylase-related dioxygenase (phytanoyl-CoA dioxygenase family)
VLTQEQREQFRRSGFVNGGPVLDEATVEVLQQEVLRVIEDRDKPEVKQPVLLRNLSTNEAAPIWQIVNIYEASPAFNDLVHNSKLAEMAATLSGAKSLRVWHDQVQYKPKALGGRLGWHQDSPLWPSLQPKTAQLTAWVALDDADADNGCMYMVPGSHLWGDKQLKLNDVEEGALLPETFDGERIHIMMCPVKRGHVHFHHALTWHGSGTNHSNRPRRAIGIHYMTENTVYDASGDHLMKQFITVADGAPMGGERFPQVWG